MGFRDDFVWGAATASYQVEGAAYEDGKGLNIWDVFCKEPGRVYNGDTGDVACDQYHRYKEDVAIMKKLGIKAYRFSVSWARIMPNGTGEINPKGIAYYKNLIHEMVENGIEPYMTLFHWDYPYELYKRGGWMNPDSVQWFADYARVIAENFSDEVKHFFTMNEPQCFIGLGYRTAEHAPGVHAPIRDTFEMAVNVLKAHGAAVKALRQYGAKDIKIGYAPTGTMCYPASDKPEDIEAARKLLFACPDNPEEWTWNVSFWSDPVILGKLPDDLVEKYGRYLPEITKEDLELMHQPLDFYGQNIYNGFEVRAGKDGKPERVNRYTGFPKTAIQWPVTPECLYWGPKFLYERYKLPVYITENGLSCHDWVSVDGKVHDPNRIDFLQTYLRQLKKASEDGVDIRGYFEWSLMDNFEWAKGYFDRFGIVFVDYNTQERIIKDSGYWYAKVIEENGENL